ncbi:MMPL family protein [Streptomyces cyanogenus]|uniref:MMPL family protein n=1 Tax=Streptomyces cyanogenus TaxID=80860 RepID=A0ABX7TSK6_STRCY|nr:MMPL family protein [Streptomyces cyanogenus]
MGAMTARQTRRRRGLPWLVLGLWVVLLAVAPPFAARLADVQHDRATDHLPASADSTRVAEPADRLPGGETTRLVLVHHRAGGLTADDRATAARQTGAVARQHTLATPPRGVPSADGTTLLYPVTSNEPGADGKRRDAFVADVRRTAHSEGGLTVRVGGPAALATDAAGVYSSLGGPLLHTTVAVVAVLLVLIYRSRVLWQVPLAVAGLSDLLARSAADGLDQAVGTSVTGQSAGIMTIRVTRCAPAPPAAW